MAAVIAPLEIHITPGEHPEGHAFGMTFNLDTIWVTVVAGLIVISLGFWAKSKLTQDPHDHVPTKIQILWETIIKEVTAQVEANLGKVNPFVIPLAVALFFFILIANWIEVIPTELNEDVHLLPSPTADTNLTYAMAIIVMVGVWTFSIRERGFKGWIKHYFEPVPWMFPLEVLQDLLKPVTLALRLFGNIFAGGIMLALIAGMVSLAPANIPVGSVLDHRLQRHLEAVRHDLPGGPAGVHLRPADRPLLRDGRSRTRRRPRRARREEAGQQAAGQEGRRGTRAGTRTSALSPDGSRRTRGNQSVGQPTPNQGEKLTWQ